MIRGTLALAGVALLSAAVLAGYAPTTTLADLGQRESSPMLLTDNVLNASLPN
jgi:hypothetical protein